MWLRRDSPRGADHREQRFQWRRQIDLLWQNSSGEVAVWEINGTSVIGSASLANPGRAWHV